ncbi:MAG TPA: competence type IV pilus minor pilin ComGD [Lentibacillus sp.]|uniref:competence type IV pilus minor pilin ComGD n=1 Tax=Lentibacillus sp. TaxID=1925746 RepID=UPI002B4B1801|nr:competence type IV pilus minor pilin ComGD [Lentibacillus sp.]HLR62415.1 competence type IV pilus minor pilin ComGD [Lentibacillus sp.]
MKPSNGFTLIEVLFVLVVLSVLILIAAPIQASVLDKKTEESFLETLEMDLLYMQSLSYNSRTNYRLAFPDQDRYVIKSTAHQDILERKVPEGWTINTRVIKTISFNKNGTIREPGTMAIYTPTTHYNLVCPLGKGRCYFDEQ